MEIDCERQLRESSKWYMDKHGDQRKTCCVDCFGHWTRLLFRLLRTLSFSELSKYSAVLGAFPGSQVSLLLEKAGARASGTFLLVVTADGEESLRFRTVFEFSRPLPNSNATRTFFRDFARIRSARCLARRWNCWGLERDTLKSPESKSPKFISNRKLRIICCKIN